MHGEEQDARLVVERGLRAVAVVHVPVDDRHALAALFEELRSRDGDVVEQTEAHGSIGRRVMTRRADEGEGDDAVVPEPRRGDGAAGGEQGGLVAARRHVRV